MLTVLGQTYMSNAYATTTPKMKKSVTLSVGQSYTLKVTGTTKKAKWTSSNKKIATVTQTGKVTTKKIGNATVTATIGKTKLKCKVTVKTLLIGHRGYSSEYPEDTIEGFTAAFENGFDGIECDVWESDNHDLMISHDPTIKRTTGKKGLYIWNVNTTNRNKYPIIKANGIDKYQDQTVLIPTLEETVKTVAKYNGYLVLHIKTRAVLGNKLSDSGVKKIIKIIKKYNLTDKTTICASNKSVLSKFKNSGIRLGNIIYPETKKDFVSEFKWLKANNVGIAMFLGFENMEKYGNNNKLFALAKKYNTEISMYTTNTDEEYTTLSNLGCDFAMSDYFLSVK
jgi:glycerophosphoryl diester phosphodiesterase